VVTHLGQSVDAIRTQLGLAAEAKAAAAAPVVPFAGELPADLKDLVDVYGIDEKRVRLLAAIESSAGKTPASPPAPVAPASQLPASPQAPAPAKPVGVDMDQLYGRKLLSDLSSQGAQNPGEQVRVLLKHPQTRQEVIKRFPGLTAAEVPAVFDSLDAATRYEILKSAHTALQAPKVPSRPASPPPPTHQRGVPVTTTPRAVAPADGDPVKAAIALLSREE
jgi:hypothetical protein